MKLISALCLLLAASTSANGQSSQQAPKKLIDFVNPLIGTQRMGHTYPGATAPFGSVQLSPETNYIPMFLDKKYNAEAYQYADSVIFGFSHTHFSGTGHSDLGDFLVMPTTGALELNPGDAHEVKNGF